MTRLKAKRKSLIEEIRKYSYFLKGSVSSLCANCHRAKCICAVKGEGKVFRLTYKDKEQKTRTIYIPRHRLSEVRTLLANYARIRRTLDLLFDHNIDTFKASDQ